jgi:hypothetical protein
MDIFTTFSVPHILLSDNGQEVHNQIMEQLCSMRNNVKIVHSKQCHSQSQRSSEHSNQDVENIISTWMETDQTKKMV